jgi:hypothetical protein
MGENFGVMVARDIDPGLGSIIGSGILLWRHRRVYEEEDRGRLQQRNISTSMENIASLQNWSSVCLCHLDTANELTKMRMTLSSFD